MEMQMAKATSNNPYNFMAPPFDNPVMNLNKILAQKNIKLNLAHGTTTLGFKYRGGIVMCADSQTSTSDLRSKKIMELDNCMLGTIAGCAGDCVHWHRVLTSECRLYRLQNGNNSMTITAASKFIHNIVNRFLGMGLSMGLILAGYDPHPDGSKLIYISNEGDRVEGNLFSIGSGSTYALGVLDSGYNWNMSDEEAFFLARRAAYNAINCDPYSGGSISLYHMTENGWKVISIENCQKFNQIQPEYAVPMDVEDDDELMLLE
ncbi:proteasome subunit beta type-5-like isoform X2 [Drosophila innubila]|nr:proteasome subunit beta type-5-like isoform X2 [Drosophila innubila]